MHDSKLKHLQPMAVYPLTEYSVKAHTHTVLNPFASYPKFSPAIPGPQVGIFYFIPMIRMVLKE